MREDLKCEFEESCAHTYPGEDMVKYRENCDFINCSLCDKYWLFYDRRAMKKMGVDEKGRRRNKK